ncbi:uncharacterized protein LOC110441518 [Mizuhopecten yessoensis]|uniref:Uncharacterized protein n=1 Tax=Mizuhopecten yessoensis TaxID=6573 RepID=A0A210PJF3_MIZYE|nr:uncharacterized protein LOC110441518 [Mizuhopecten yessoensis]OWF36546.1 hypothetical protein KP79_PYT03126 [Mizuhopecten yessoensis]
MALYKALMEETPLSRTKEPDSAIDDSTEVLSNSEGISSLITRKYFDPVTDNNDSEASTNVSELPYTVLNSSRDHENTTCGKSSSSLTDHNIFSEIPSSSAPENILTEITTELVCDTRLTETSFRQQPSSEESPSLTGVRRDTLGDHGDSSTQAIGDDGGINVDRYQPGPRVTVHNLHQSALARRDEMVKDLSVDGSGLKVMCCLLGVIVVFAIAIISIVVTGL